MNRRKLLSIAGVATLPTLSGCQTFGSTLESDPARFEDVALSGPDAVAVGESFSLSVSVTNEGGRAGAFADALTVADASDSPTKIRISDVAPASSRAVEVGPYAVGRAGDHRFRLAESGATHTVSVSARTLGAGERFSLANGPTVSVSNASFRTALFYDASDGRGVLAPDDGAIFAVVRVSVENRGKSELETGPESFRVADGEVVAEFGRGDGTLAALSGPDADPFSEGSIAPGEARSGWILAEVERERAGAGLRVAWNRERDGSTPEVRWEFGSAELPAFSVTDLTLPAETEAGASLTATATVTNAGTASGTYRGVLERRRAEDTAGTEDADWSHVATFAREIAPGSSATVTTPVEGSAAGRVRYRLRPGSATETVNVLAARRSLGEQFTTPRGTEIRVEIGSDQFDGLLSTYIYDDEDDRTVRARPDHTFAFVSVSVENVADEAVEFPSWDAFSVVADETPYSVFHSSSSGDVTFLSPVSGLLYHPTRTYEPGETYSGWQVFQIPDDVAISELAVQYAPNDVGTATWSG